MEREVEREQREVTGPYLPHLSPLWPGVPCPFFPALDHLLLSPDHLFVPPDVGVGTFVLLHAAPMQRDAR